MSFAHEGFRPASHHSMSEASPAGCGACVHVGDMVLEFFPRHPRLEDVGYVLSGGVDLRKSLRSLYGVPEDVRNVVGDLACPAMGSKGGFIR